jgi:hypothetical protein
LATLSSSRQTDIHGAANAGGVAPSEASGWLGMISMIVLGMRLWYGLHTFTCTARSCASVIRVCTIQYNHKYKPYMHIYRGG